MAGSYLTDPEPDDVLIDFYTRVKPWGFWGPVLAKVRERHPDFQPNRNFKRAMFNVVVGTAWQTTLVALPIFIVIHETISMLVTLGVLAVTSLILKFNWWNKLDEISDVDDEIAARGDVRARPAAPLAAAGAHS